MHNYYNKPYPSGAAVCCHQLQLTRSKVKGQNAHLYSTYHKKIVSKSDQQFSVMGNFPYTKICKMLSR